MDDCVFCKIVQGRLPSRRVYEDDTVVAFHDVNPVGPIHVLIVPRVHLPTMNDLAEDDRILSHMGKAARQIARDLGVDRDGYRFYVNVGQGGGQVVFHLHAHLIAGRSLGMGLIRVAVACAIGSRKLLGLLGIGNSRSDST